MPLWIDAVLAVVLALLIDRFVGEVPNSVHPLRWMGNILGAIDRRVANRTARSASAAGFLSWLFVFLLFGGAALALTSFVRAAASAWDPLAGEICWIIATAFVFKVSFAVFSFRRHVDPVCADLDAGDAEGAASKVQMIVSRDTKGMDAEHIASSCCETVSENLVDSVFSPAFYFGIFGLPGAAMFRCANLMDAMWGYLNEKYARLGFFPAKFDDVLGFLTSRISPYFVAFAALILGMEWRKAVPAAKAEHGKTPSPNSGWSMTAVSAALGISMEKKDVYVMGEGPLPSVADVKRCCRLVELSSIVFVLTVSLVLYALAGVRVQIFCENFFFGFWGALF